MYQTGGLFHPLLSQRIYQSNQGLKLSAKAFRLPKGAVICLKSRPLSSDSTVDKKQKRSGGLAGGAPHRPQQQQRALLASFPQLPTPPPLPPLVFIWLHLSGPHFQSSTSSASGFQLTGPTKHPSPACRSQCADPGSGRGGPGHPPGRLCQAV